jgi:hypothetical protein
MDVLLEVPLQGSEVPMVVEVDQEQAGPVPAGRAGEIVNRATEDFQSALSGALGGAQALLEKLQSISAPDQVLVEFGLKVTAEAGVVISKLGSEVNFKVGLTWKRNQSP